MKKIVFVPTGTKEETLQYANLLAQYLYLCKDKMQYKEQSLLDLLKVRLFSTPATRNNNLGHYSVWNGTETVAIPATFMKKANIFLVPIGNLSNFEMLDYLDNILVSNSNNYKFKGISPQIAELSTNLFSATNKDPADRIISATAIIENADLVIEQHEENKDSLIRALNGAIANHRKRARATKPSRKHPLSKFDEGERRLYVYYNANKHPSIFHAKSPIIVKQLIQYFQYRLEKDIDAILLDLRLLGGMSNGLTNTNERGAANTLLAPVLLLCHLNG